MDYIYGIISQKAKEVEYLGTDSSSATTTINGKNISVTVKRPVPEIDSAIDIGKVLTVQSGTIIGWESPLPSYDPVGDVGKKLTISAEGNLVWA